MEKLPDPARQSALQHLREAYKASRAPLWLEAETKIRAPRSRKPRVNLVRIVKATMKDDVVLVPGKVLGSGRVTHPVIVGAFEFSRSAFSRIVDAGGEALFISEFVERYPKGTGVTMIGG